MQENSQKSISSPISISNQDRIIEVDEMLNDDWKRKSSSSSPIIKTDSQPILTQMSEIPNDVPEKPKPTVQIPVHVIIKSCESSSASLQPAARLSSNLPQLSPLSQPNEITSNMANASQQLRSIMSSINQTTSTTTGLATVNQNKPVTTNVEMKTKEGQVSVANSLSAVNVATSNKLEGTSTNIVPTSFENVLAVNRSNELNLKTEFLPKIVTETVPTSINASKILTSQAFTQNNIGTITTSSGGSILVVKQLRAVSPMTSRSRSPVTVNSSGTKTQTFSVVKSMSGAPAVIISGQAAQQGSSVIITQNKIPIFTKVATTTSIASASNTIAVSTNSISVATSVARCTTQPMSILSNTLSQPQQSRIVPYAEGQHITISKKPSIKMQPILTKIENATVVSNASVTSASSTAAIQNILQSGLYSGSILSATLNQPPQKPPNAKLLQTQATNNPFRRSKSTDEVPGFLKETPAQIISKRHSSMEASNTIKEEKDETSQLASGGHRTVESTTENCKFTTVTIHKSDESQNVLLKQLLQQASNTTPSPSPLPTIVSRSVTSLRAPSLGVVSSLEAQLARPVILPVPATPNTIQSKPNTHVTGKIGLIFRWPIYTFYMHYNYS